MPPPLVFISHSSDDQERARALAADLRNNGIDVWIDHEQVRFGESIPRRISEGLSTATVLLVLVSRSFIRSSWCRAEYEAFLMKEISSGQLSVIPVRLDDAEMPVLLQAKSFFDLRHGTSGWHWDEFISQVRDASTKTFVNRIPKSPSYHTSLLSMIIGGVVRDFPASTMTDDEIVSGRSLVDLFRTVDALVSEFQEITEFMMAINYPTLLGEDGYRDSVSKGTHGTYGGWEALRRAGELEREMRTVVTAFDGILEAHSALRKRLDTVFQLCVAVDRSDQEILLSLGTGKNHSRFVGEEAEPSSANTEEGWLDKRKQIQREYGQLLVELSQYRHDLRDAVARAAAGS